MSYVFVRNRLGTPYPGCPVRVQRTVASTSDEPHYVGQIVVLMLEPSLFDRQPSLSKRAYQLARSGSCKDLTQISRRLEMEGYASASIQTYLGSQSISADLTYICEIADKR